MSQPLSWMKFDVEKWFGSISTQRMSFAEKGVYFVMLCQEWRDPSRSLPDDPEAVADLVTVTPAQRAELLAAWSTVRARFEKDKRRHNNRIFNVALERTRRDQHLKLQLKTHSARVAGKASARKRLRDKALDVNGRSTDVDVGSTSVNGKERKGEVRKGEVRKGKEEVSISTSVRSRRPIFSGQRLTVFDWMLDDLMRMLGSHTNDFDLHEWFFKADETAMRESIVVADWWPWLRAETMREAQRRGLPIAVANEPTTPHGKLTQRMTAMVANSRRPQ